MRNFSFFFISGLLLLTGCAREELEKVDVAENLSVMTATFADSATKSAMDDQAHFSWLADDSFSQLVKNSESQSYYATYELMSNSGLSTGDFSAALTSGYALYDGAPAFYPADLTPDANGTSITVPASRTWKEDETYNTMYGVYSSAGNGVQFAHLGGIVRVTLENVPATTTKFVFSTDKKINGTFSIADGKIQTATAATDAEKSYTLTFDALASAQNMVFYVPLPVGEFSYFQFELFAGENRLFKFKGSSTQTVAKADFLKMPDLAISTIGGTGGDASTAAVTKVVPADFSGDYILPASENVALSFVGGNSGVINLKYDGSTTLPTHLTLRVADGKTVSVSGNLPSTTVVFDSGNITTAEFTTAANTFKVVAPAKITEKLTVKGGNVEIHGATVQAIEVAENAFADQDKTMPVQITVTNTEGNTAAITEGVTANASIIVNNTTPAEGSTGAATVKVTVPEEVVTSVSVATSGTGKVEDASGNEIALVKIGAKKYATLADAIDAVPTDGTPATIVIAANVDLAKALTVKSGQDITLDLNGKTVKNDASKSLSQLITVNGKLTIDDSSADKAGNIVNATDKKYVLATGAADAVLTLANGTVQSTTGTTSKSVNASKGIFVMTGGKIISTGYGVSATTVNISGGEIEAYDMAVSAGGTISGGTFKSTTKYAVYTGTSSNKEMIVSGGTFTPAAGKAAVQIFCANAKVTGGTFNVSNAKVIDFSVNTTGVILPGSLYADDVTDSEIYVNEKLYGYYSIAATNMMNAPAGATVKLTKDVNVNKYITVRANVVAINLNGKNISSTGTTALDIYEGTAKARHNLVIDGEGTISANNGGACNTINVNAGVELTIKGGTYDVGGESDNATIYIMSAYSARPSTVNIEGGSFIANNAWILNIKDSVRDYAKFSVTGGSFKGFNPASCGSEGQNTNFVADGYEATENNGVWTVTKAQ